MKTYLLYLPLIILILSSCCKYSKEQEIENLVKTWVGKEIKFPLESQLTSYEKKQVNYKNTSSDFKVLIYIDSIGCSSCKLQLDEWTVFINQIDSLTNKSVPFMFFLHPKDMRELKTYIKLKKFKHPVFFDKDDKLNKINKFPSNVFFQTFLLDKDNKTVVIGNPIINPKVKELYLNKLLRYPNKILKDTNIEIESYNIDLGSFNWKIPQDTTIKIKNIGNNNLTIIDLTSSCDCTLPECDLTTVEPGGIINLKIIFRAERPEYFERNVIVHCNTKEPPIEIQIRGEGVKE